MAADRAAVSKAPVRRTQPFVAKYTMHCNKCGLEIWQGEDALYIDGYARHLECDEDE